MDDPLSNLFDRENMLHSPEAVESFVTKITAGMFHRPERRAEQRHPVALVVDAQSLDEQLQPAGPPFRAVTRDISNSGIGLTHNQRLDSRFLAVQLWSAEGEKLQTVVEILRSQPMGSIFDIGGRFVTAGEAADEPNG